MATLSVSCGSTDGALASALAAGQFVRCLLRMHFGSLDAQKELAYNTNLNMAEVQVKR